MGKGLKREVKNPKDKYDFLCIIFHPTVLLLEITLQRLLPQSVLLGDPAKWDHNFAEGRNLGQVVFPGLFHLCGNNSCGKVE